MRNVAIILLAGLASLDATGQFSVVEGQTLTGLPLRAPDWSEATRERLELDLAIARAQFDVAPDREDSYIWLGRRLGYLGRYADAVEVFTAGLEKFPESYKLHRFRGRHRARSRDFDGAIADYRDGLRKMRGLPDSFEPDGMPNARGLTISTYRSNLHYYLGQTSFAIGDYRQMIDALDRSADSPIAIAADDHRVARVFWKYIAYRKLNEAATADALIESVPEDLDLIENASYHNAVKVLQGKVSPQAVKSEGDSLARFALGMRFEFGGNRAESDRILNALVADSPLGYWPAEAELLRRRAN